MRRRELFASALALSTLAALPALAYDHKKASDIPGGDPYGKCAKACTDCKAVCAACVKHCQSMVAAGQKQHTKSLALSRDAADLCDVAARIVARKGPSSRAVCEACVKACEACRAECKKYPTMKPMKDCVDSCTRCIAACKEMLTHVPR